MSEKSPSQSGSLGKERAFAQRLHKRTASIGQDQVQQRPQTVIMVPFSDVIDPLDFEDFILQQQPGNDEVDGADILAEFPDDDIEVTTLPRKFRTIQPPVPPDLESNVSPHVKDCIHSYTSDWAVVNRKYQFNTLLGNKNDLKKKISRSESFAQKIYKQEYEADEKSKKVEAKPPLTETKSGGDAPRGSWASSILDLQSSQPDQLLPNLLENLPQEEIDRLNLEQRKSHRTHAMFAVYNSGDEEESIVKRIPSVIPLEHCGQRILVKCEELKLDLDIEPIFGIMALYDCKLKRKISENFHFDMNKDSNRRLLSTGKQDISSLARSCIFSVTYPSSEVYLVVKIEKVLQQGDISECAEPYMKDADNPKVREKARSNAEGFCEKYGKFRMPFAWTAIHLVDLISGGGSTYDGSAPQEGQPITGSKDSSLKKTSPDLSGQRTASQKQGSVNRKPSSSTETGKQATGKAEKVKGIEQEDGATDLSNFRPVTLNVSTIFKQEADKLTDEDLFKFLADLRRPTSVLRRLKCIPGYLKLDICPPSDNLMYTLTPELQQIHPYPDMQGRPIKEIQEFAPKEVFVPYVTYRNSLYIYPKQLNFSNRTGSARNIAVKVQFMAGEDNYQAMKCICGRSSGAELLTEAWSSVTYHNKTPSFYEEIKILLPSHLTEQHHLLFTFYHISFKVEAPGPIEPTPIGTTWIPILKDGRMQLGEFNLPVAIDKLPQSYSVLSTEVQLPGMKWVDGHKGVFNVDVHTKSSIHTQDIYIHRFFRLCHQAENRLPSTAMKSPDVGNLEAALRKSVKDLEKAQSEPLIKFLHMILDKLLMLLVRPPTAAGTVVNVSQAAFESLTDIIHRVHALLEYKQDKHGRNSVLASYVAFVFNAQGVMATDSTPLNSPGKSLGIQRPTSMSINCNPSLSDSKSLSNSNPNVSHPHPTHGISASVGTREPWMAESLGSYSNVPGNRNSASEQCSTPGRLMTGSKTPTNTSKKLVHEELALQWAVSLHPFKDMAMAHAWFFFELMAKSMAQYLDAAEKFFWLRKERFQERFLDDISALVNTVTAEVLNKQERNFRTARLLNASLGFFLNDILSLMDRGFVLVLIRNYMKEMALKDQTDPNINFLKLELLHIICCHEHFVVLNLPFPVALEHSPRISPSPSMMSISSAASSMFSSIGRSSPMSVAELSTEFREQHYLVGLLLCELRNSFDSMEQDLMRQAVDVVKDLISLHDSDTRYDSVHCRHGIASLYLPLVAIAMDVLPQLYGYESEKDSIISEAVAMAIAMSSVPARQSSTMQREDGRSEYSTQMSKQVILNLESTKHLLMCVLWVLKNIDTEFLQKWWSRLSANRLIRLLDVLDLCVKLFEYHGKKIVMKGSNNLPQPRPGKRGKGVQSDAKMRLQTLEEAILNKGAAREMLQRHKTTAIGGPEMLRDESPQLRWRKDNTYWKKSAEQGTRGQAELDSQLEGSMSAEVAMVILDTLEWLVQTVSSSDSLRNVITTGLRVLFHALGCNQSTLVLQNMLSTERSIVRKFPELLFEDDLELCADLCFRLLTHCSSSLDVVRSHASASLYLLMRQNYEIGNNFARVKMQVTMSLSALVGSTQSFNEEHLRRSLKTIMTYAQTEQQLKAAPFPEQVRELVLNLHMILSDTVKMKEYQEDPEMLIDLMYRIAKGYQNSPDLRLTWLQNMASKHTESGCHTEAGLCLVHSAALVSEYLSMLEDKRYLPIGCVDFERVSTNVLEESAVSDDVLSPDAEGICSAKYFTENGLIGLLEQAAYAFSMASMYELVSEVFKLLIPIHEAKRDHKKLGSIYNKLAEAYSRIMQTEGKRMMGTYFRVGFYGSRFGDIDGEEFIYKEPAITKLPETSHRLQGFYGEKFGPNVVEIIKDSNVVDPMALDSEKAYIQITYVEPYFEEYEMEDRITYFDKNNNLRRFMFVTPFTVSGKAHGDLSNQFKRKTILTVANAFPYIKTRVNVVHREELVLEPIEVAVEDIQTKTRELWLAIHSNPPDAKMLQMVLQGCVGTTVNQGPLEIANVFLSDLSRESENDIEVTRNHHKLRLCFKEFVKRCGEALHRNKTLITHDQRAYQKELERNYRGFVEKLEPLLRSRFGTMRGSLRRKDGTPIFRQVSGTFKEDQGHLEP